MHLNSVPLLPVLLNQLFFRHSSVSNQKLKFQFFSALLLLFLKKRKRLIFPRVSLTIFFSLQQYFLLMKLSHELH